MSSSMKMFGLNATHSFKYFNDDCCYFSAGVIDLGSPSHFVVAASFVCWFWRCCCCCCCCQRWWCWWWLGWRAPMRIQRPSRIKYHHEDLLRKNCWFFFPFVSLLFFSLDSVPFVKNAVVVLVACFFLSGVQYRLQTVNSHRIYFGEIVKSRNIVLRLFIHLILYYILSVRCMSLFGCCCRCRCDCCCCCVSNFLGTCRFVIRLWISCRMLMSTMSWELKFDEWRTCQPPIE